MGEYLTTVAKLTRCSECLRPMQHGTGGHARSCSRYGLRADITDTEARTFRAQRAAASSRTGPQDG